MMLLLICIPVNAASLAAHVILSKGVATATDQDGKARPLKRRSKVFSGDIIKTGPKGSVQLRFVDKALMTIKASSEMDISSYLFNQPGDTSKKEQALMTLVKGGFRTISGQIGKGEKSAYKVDTPAASIGIRGTNYEVQQEASGAYVMAVYSGGISVENDSGTIELGLGSDFNFTRVTSSESPPVGLLAAPESLSVNAATDDNSEEEKEEVAQTSEGESDGQATEDSESEEESSEEGGTAVVAVSEDGSSSETSTVESATVSEVVSVIQTEMKALDEGTQEALADVIAALDEKNTREVDENTEVLKDNLEDELKDAGVLTGNESLEDLEAAALENLADLGSLEEVENAIDLGIDLAEEDAVEDAIEDGIIEDPTPDTTPDPIVDNEPDPVVDPNPLGLFDFDDAYANLDSVTNPLPNSVISDEQFDLVSSEKLALMAMPLGYELDSDGRPVFNTHEAQVSSPLGLDIGNFTAFDYSGQDNSTGMMLNYQVLNTSTGETDEYQIQIEVDFNVVAIGDLEINIQDALINGDVTKNGNTVTSPGHVQLILATQTIIDPDTNTSVDVQRFVFQPTTATGEFITEMALHFREDGSAQSQQLAIHMGSNGLDNEEWRANIDVEVFVGDGSWNETDNTPIFVMSEQQEDNGQFYDRTEVITKPGDPSRTVSSPTALALCADLGIICDIQKDDVAEAINIRWGVWLAEPGDGINIYELTEDELGFTDSSTHQEEEILAFWLAAERADINTLTGTANFSSNFSNCTDYAQCIGFADDGAVRSVVGRFDVNFDNGAISNGQMKIETAGSEINDPDSLPLSVWEINFNGQMSNDSSGNRTPEFQTNSLNGTVTDGTTNTLISNTIIGNVGGIFVKPGDVFAGGYNLGTADGTNKHAAGVFTLGKQP
jgi:hypothetical protein